MCDESRQPCRTSGWKERLVGVKEAPWPLAQLKGDYGIEAHWPDLCHSCTLPTVGLYLL